MAKPIAGVEEIGYTDEGSSAVEINLITNMALISPSNNEPVSPIKILAGE